MSNFIITCSSCCPCPEINGEYETISTGCASITPCTGECLPCLNCPTDIPNLPSINIPSIKIAQNIRKGGTMYWTSLLNGGGPYNCPSCYFPGGEAGISIMNNCDGGGYYGGISCTPGTFSWTKCLHSTSFYMYLREINGSFKLFINASSSMNIGFTERSCVSSVNIEWPTSYEGMQSSIQTNRDCTVKGGVINARWSPFYPL